MHVVKQQNYACGSKEFSVVLFFCCKIRNHNLPIILQYQHNVVMSLMRPVYVYFFVFFQWMVENCNKLVCYCSLFNHVFVFILWWWRFLFLSSFSFEFEILDCASLSSMWNYNFLWRIYHTFFLIVFFFTWRWFRFIAFLSSLLLFKRWI